MQNSRLSVTFLDRFFEISSSLVLQPTTGLDHPNYVFPLVSLLCLIYPSLDSKQILFHSVKPPNWRSLVVIKSSFQLAYFGDSQQLFLLLDEVVGLLPNPQPGGPGCLSLSGTSTCLAWETLPVATLPSA
jgi:hypothetical protein